MSTLICPRCGYDLSGVATWTDTCPLHGTCSECGHPFEWADIYDPDRRDLRGFVEHATRRRFPLWSIRTLLWALNPFLFWRQVTLNQRLNGRAMLWWLLLLTLTSHIVSSLLLTIRLVLHHVTGGMTPWPIDYAMAWLPAVRVYSWGDVELSTRLLGAMAPLAAAHLSFLVMIVILSESRKLAAIRLAHVLRAFVYAFALLTPVVVLALLRQALMLAGGLIKLFGPAGTMPPLNVLDDWIIAAIGLLFLAGASIYILLWWYLAIVRAWRFDRGRTVWALLTVIAVLSGAIAGVTFMYPRY